jgi:hypothetical protein
MRLQTFAQEILFLTKAAVFWTSLKRPPKKTGEVHEFLLSEDSLW